MHHEFRAGSLTAGTGALGFIKECEKKLPAGKRLYWRSDSAWYQAEVVNDGSQGRRSFSITADQDSAVKAAIAQIPASAWQKFYSKDGTATDREISETVHCMNETKQAFRLLVLRWPNPQPDLFTTTPYFYHAIATNRLESASAVIHLHNQRGESENWHKELNSVMGWSRCPAANWRPTPCFSPSACWLITWACS